MWIQIKKIDYSSCDSHKEYVISYKKIPLWKKSEIEAGDHIHLSISNKFDEYPKEYYWMEVPNDSEFRFGYH